MLVFGRPGRDFIKQRAIASVVIFWIVADWITGEVIWFELSCSLQKADSSMAVQAFSNWLDQYTLKNLSVVHSQFTSRARFGGDLQQRILLRSPWVLVCLKNWPRARWSERGQLFSDNSLLCMRSYLFICHRYIAIPITFQPYKKNGLI